MGYSRVPVKVTTRRRVYRRPPRRLTRSTHTWRTSDPPAVIDSEADDAELSIEAA